MGQLDDGANIGPEPYHSRGQWSVSQSVCLSVTFVMSLHIYSGGCDHVIVLTALDVADNSQV